MIAFVFAQCLVSAHACDARQFGRSGEVVAHIEGCPGAAQDEVAGDNLCEQHCQYGHASLDSNPPAPMAMNVSGPVFRVEAVAADCMAVSPPSRRLVPAFASPPPAILFGVLRI
ncbi:MAG TPA: hypothetical protein VFV55_11690 [Usitatibacteraceae bacterium]|nr:hypothetical protein [Usitatibacteraceae bacterium]